MSEEQPVFKITDRRLFNADGSPREGGTREDTATNDSDSASAELNADANQAINPGSGSATGAAPAAQAATPVAPVKSAESFPTGSGAIGQTEPSGQSEENFAEDEMGGAYDDDDPASFTSFLMSIASNAAASLGLMEHPATGLRAVDLPLAKHWIDTLGMLQQKTRGNLTPQERQIMEGLLADMRMQFVALTTGGGPGGPASRGGAAGSGSGGGRKFSGSDITGGR
jgi:hypothetical protein